MAAAQRPDGGNLKRVESYQWPTGHVAHLTDGQQSALKQFKELCQQKGYYHPGDEKRPASHDDETMLRYLRARKFISKDAFTQFKGTEDWRAANQLDTLYDTIDVEEYDATRRLYPQWTGRRDKRGIPFYVFEVGGLKSKDVAAYEGDKDRKKSQKKAPVDSKEPRKMLRLFALYENLCRFVLPLCSAIPDRPNSETPISQSSNLVDISGVGLTQFWSLRAHLQDSSSLATAHYPETLDRIFIVGAPSFFPKIWDWAKGWFDPVTVQKIQIVSQKNMLSTLTQFVEIENIPKKYGGNLDWNFGDMPMFESAIADKLRWKEEIMLKGHRSLPKGPIKWTYDEEGDLMAVETGTEKGQQRQRYLAGLHPDDHTARLALSPGRDQHSALFKTIAGSGATTAVQKQNTPVETKSNTAVETKPNTAIETNGSVDKPKMSGVADLDVGKSEGSAVQPTSIEGIYTVPQQEHDIAVQPQSTGGMYLSYRDQSNAVQPSNKEEQYTVPYRDHDNAVHSPPIDSRQGTSATRYEQQAGTHAEGTLAHGTPATREDGQGVKHAIMDPTTVGQAPKETPLYREEDSAPTMMEQAQQYAAQAMETAKHVPAMAMSAVGMGGGEAKEEEKVEEPVAKKEDPRMDGMNQAQLEEFLRTQTMSKQKQSSTDNTRG